MTMACPRRRIRTTGLVPGVLPTGPLNALTDVAGVRVGHATVLHDEGPARTGVTVILPHGGDPYRFKARAAVHTINGYGKAFGFEQVRELGLLESPIALTNTLNVGLVADALIRWSMDQNPEIGRSSSLNVVVGETNDGFLNDLQGRFVRFEHVHAALTEAGAGPVAEGSLGAGTGTTCFGWKGGIGTASRIVPPGFTIGALVQSNFGRAEELTILGVPVGRHLVPPGADGPERGSIMIVLATDAPLSERQLGRLCTRAAAGLARVGGTFGHGSGDFVIAFTTADPVPHEPERLLASRMAVIDEEQAMRSLFPATIEAVEEAVLNSLFMATPVTGREGHVRHALPVEQVLELMGWIRPSL
jgi:D-aminopeptidase